MVGPRLGKVKLSPKEKHFLREYFRNGYNSTTAYMVIAPKGANRDSAGVLGSRLLSKIKKKDCWLDILDSAGLDDMRIAQSLGDLLQAEKTEFYQGDAVAEVADNATRMRATELLAELRGKKKGELDLTLRLPQVVEVDYGDGPDASGEADPEDDTALEGEDPV